jgi:hypothetical protein
MAKEKKPIDNKRVLASYQTSRLKIKNIADRLLRSLELEESKLQGLKEKYQFNQFNSELVNKGILNIQKFRSDLGNAWGSSLKNEYLE